jgi:hypothetical protein
MNVCEIVDPRAHIYNEWSSPSQHLANEGITIMQPEIPVSNNGQEALKGLPPVQPPSGKFLAQLFLIPLGIVTVAMGVIWFLTWLVGGFFSPDQLMKDLRSGNTEVRWRRASDLAQVLKRDDNLAANPAFALELADLLQQALKDNQDAERAYAQKLSSAPQSPADEKKKLEPPKELRDERSFVEFLISCVGNLSIPTGVPVLSDIAVQEAGNDPDTVRLRQQLAVWALANIGEGFKRFDRLPQEKREAVIAALDAEAESESPSRRQLARMSRDYLKGRAAGTPTALGVDKTLEKCADSDDLTLRKFVALALNFWEGTPEENERMEATLLKLSDGSSFPSSADRVKIREVRYQAAQALAHRGSKKLAERLPIFREMLNEEELAKIFKTKVKGEEQPDTAIIGVIMSGALKSLADFHRNEKAKSERVDLSSVYPDIEALAKHANPAIRKEAERTLLELKPAAE